MRHGSSDHDHDALLRFQLVRWRQFAQISIFKNLNGLFVSVGGKSGS